ELAGGGDGARDRRLLRRRHLHRGRRRLSRLHPRDRGHGNERDHHHGEDPTKDRHRVPPLVRSWKRAKQTTTVVRARLRDMCAAAASPKTRRITDQRRNASKRRNCSLPAEKTATLRSAATSGGVRIFDGQAMRPTTSDFPGMGSAPPADAASAPPNEGRPPT